MCFKFCVFDFCSYQQRANDDTLLQGDEQKRRLHLDADVRHGRLQFEKRRRAEHHLRQLRGQVNRLHFIFGF